MLISVSSLAKPLPPASQRSTNNPSFPVSQNRQPGTVVDGLPLKKKKINPVKISISCNLPGTIGQVILANCGSQALMGSGWVGRRQVWDCVSSGDGGNGELGERAGIHEKINPAFPSQAWRLKREIAGLMNLIRVAVPVNFRVIFRYY